MIVNHRAVWTYNSQMLQLKVMRVVLHDADAKMIILIMAWENVLKQTLVHAL
jgi:hypothetical protein